MCSACHTCAGAVCVVSQPFWLGERKALQQCASCVHTENASPQLCRAYVHHLLEAKEMLGGMLLEYHNVHHMQRFVAAIRDSLRAGTFPEFMKFFNVDEG
jgi:tRNA-guanine family transglycosylase